MNKHLSIHTIGLEWLEMYKKSRRRTGSSIITDDTLDLVRWFISSNASLESLENVFLRRLLSDKFDLPHSYSFINTIIPEIISKLRNSIQEKLFQAETICLISDMWTNKQNSDFIGLAAVITNKSWEREIIVIDMIRMPGNDHRAENIKIAIEQMIISYSFDKSKISSIVSDQGSNFVRLFKQIPNNELEDDEVLDIVDAFESNDDLFVDYDCTAVEKEIKIIFKDVQNLKVSPSVK